MNKSHLTETRSAEWKPTVYGVGVVVGLLVGLLAAHLYTQAVEQNQDITQAGERPKLGALDLVSLGTLALSVIRQVTDLGARTAPKR